MSNGQRTNHDSSTDFQISASASSLSLALVLIVDLQNFKRGEPEAADNKKHQGIAERSFVAIHLDLREGHGALHLGSLAGDKIDSHIRSLHRFCPFRVLVFPASVLKLFVGSLAFPKLPLRPARADSAAFHCWPTWKACSLWQILACTKARAISVG